MACRGEEGSQITEDQQGGQGVPVEISTPFVDTCAEPPPVSTYESAWLPMTAMDLMVEAFKGSRLLLF
jgi:hypothetical protein